MVTSSACRPSSRRARTIVELGAAMFHPWGLDRSDIDHILDSFPIVRRNQERDHEVRTKRLALAAYDGMADAARTSVPFTSPFRPPGHGPRHPLSPASRTPWMRWKWSHAWLAVTRCEMR